MRYDWICTCGATIEVTRLMSQSDVGPRRCPGCSGSGPFCRKLVAPQLMVTGGRSESAPWPLRLTGIEKREEVRAPDGKLLGFQRKPVVAHSHQEYKEILARRDMVMMAEGEDPRVGPSQRSVYDSFADPPAPTARATSLNEGAFFVEDPNELGEVRV